MKGFPFALGCWGNTSEMASGKGIKAWVEEGTTQRASTGPRFVSLLPRTSSLIFSCTSSLLLQLLQVHLIYPIRVSSFPFLLTSRDADSSVYGGGRLVHRHCQNVPPRVAVHRVRVPTQGALYREQGGADTSFVCVSRLLTARAGRLREQSMSV